MTREMSRYFSVLDGASLTNEDEVGDPRYYGYTRPGGTFIIMEYNVAQGTYRFFLGNGNSTFDTRWSNRASLTYKKVGEFKKL